MLDQGSNSKVIRGDICINEERETQDSSLVFGYKSRRLYAMIVRAGIIEIKGPNRLLLLVIVKDTNTEQQIVQPRSYKRSPQIRPAFCRAFIHDEP